MYFKYRWISDAVISMAVIWKPVQLSRVMFLSNISTYFNVIKNITPFPSVYNNCIKENGLSLERCFLITFLICHKHVSAQAIWLTRLYILKRGILLINSTIICNIYSDQQLLKFNVFYVRWKIFPVILFSFDTSINKKNPSFFLII